MTPPIPLTASAEQFKSILLKAFTFLTDLKVVRYRETSTIIKWHIYFLNNPGKMLMLTPVNVNLTPAKSGLDDFMTGSYVDVVSLVVGSAPPLGGSVSLTGGTRLTPTAAVPIGTAPQDVGPYIGATVQSMASYSGIPDPGVSDPDTIWVVTFGVNQGDVSALIVDTSLLTGLNPTAEVAEMVKGQSSSSEAQGVTATCTGVFVASAFFGISLGNQQTSVIPVSGLTSESIKAALLELVGVQDVLVSAPVLTTKVLSFTVTFTDVDLPLPLPLMSLVPPACSSNSYATVAVDRTAVGTVYYQSFLVAFLHMVFWPIDLFLLIDFVTPIFSGMYVNIIIIIRYCALSPWCNNPHFQRICCGVQGVCACVCVGVRALQCLCC